MEARTSIIEKRLSSIKRIIAVASGKGGVGKSLVASTLALNLIKKGKKVGLLDLDLYGPSFHIILDIHDVFPSVNAVRKITAPTKHRGAHYNLEPSI